MILFIRYLSLIKPLLNKHFTSIKISIYLNVDFNFLFDTFFSTELVAKCVLQINKTNKITNTILCIG